jgi:hypothetical protein
VAIEAAGIEPCWNPGRRPEVADLEQRTLGAHLIEPGPDLVGLRRVQGGVVERVRRAVADDALPADDPELEGRRDPGVPRVGPGSDLGAVDELEDEVGQLTEANPVVQADVSADAESEVVRGQVTREVPPSTELASGSTASSTCWRSSR